MRCIGVLAVVSLALGGLVIGLALKGLPGGAGGAGVFFAWWSWLVASVLVMLVGWPAGGC